MTLERSSGRSLAAARSMILVLNRSSSGVDESRARPTTPCLRRPLHRTIGGTSNSTPSRGHHPPCTGASCRSAVAVAALALAMGLDATPSRAAEAEPVRLIFDTDICGDCDDVLALGMIHSLQSRGHCRLLAVTISVDHEQAAPFVDAVNTFYGRGDIPIGVVGKGGVVEKSAFLSLVDEKDAAGHFRYPHDLLSGRSAPGATAVLRKTLAAQPDRSVVIAQVGFSTNLARLLDSPPDEHSPLSGPRAGPPQGQAALADGRRVHADRGQSATTWNTTSSRTSRVPRRSPIDGRPPWSTAASRSGSRCRTRRPASSATTATCRIIPLAEAYIRRNPPPHNRPTWDLTSVLYGDPRRPRLLRPLAGREGDRRGRRLHPVRGDLAGEATAT